MRLGLIGALAVTLAIAIAFGVADASYTLAAITTAAILWLIVEWVHGPLPDAVVLVITLAGYIVGNRGFAQISLTTTLPLLPAEAALLVCVSALILRWAFKQVPMFTTDGLNIAIGIWIALGLSRLPLDLRRHGFLALRDFATVYYAAFFFIAQALARHEKSRILMRRGLGNALGMLPLVSAAFILAPGVFLDHLTVRGVPLVYLKGDLAAAFLAGGFFYFWSWYETRGLRWWLIPASICLLMSPNVGSPRSAMIGTIMVSLGWIAVRRIRLLGFQAALVTAALIAVLPVLAVTNKDFKDTPLYSIYEHAISIFDLAGRGEYRHAETGDPGDNNRFRLVWWRSVVDDTLENGPVFGLGFGADLAARFLVEYDMLAVDDFNARSPHSILMSMFGRMGFAGLFSFLAIAAMMVRFTWPAFRRWDFESMGLWSVAWVLWFSACFGVVLEGPMGAVVFWTVLGIAHESTQRAAQEVEEEVPETALEADSEAVPVI